MGDLVRVSLSQGQFDALVSFVFNVGRERFRRSTLLSAINTGELWKAPDELRRWVYQGRKRSPGLVNRRARGIRLFTRGDEPAMTAYVPAISIDAMRSR